MHRPRSGGGLTTSLSASRCSALTVSISRTPRRPATSGSLSWMDNEDRRYQRILGLDRSRENVVFDDANHFHYLALRGDEIDLVEESF